jgi:hypothetical protein
MALLLSTDRGAGHMEKHIRYGCKVFSRRYVATTRARTAENTAPLLLAACVFERVYLTTGLPGVIA